MMLDAFSRVPLLLAVVVFPRIALREESTEKRRISFLEDWKRVE